MAHRSLVAWSLAATLGLSPLSGCAHMKTGGSREAGKEQDSGRSVTEAELQENLQRFTSEYFDRTAEAVDEVEKDVPPEQFHALLKRVLLYDSAALEIASGKLPSVNMLDMLVFTTLTRDRFEQYWQPKVFHEAGVPLLGALKDLEADMWSRARRVMRPEQEARLRGMIEDWRRANPDLLRVELIRFSAFSKLAGKVASEKESGGLFRSLTSVTQTADEAVLLGERAMFLAQFAPFLMRMQGRVGAYEVTHDSLSQLSGQAALLDRTDRLLARTEQLLDRASLLVQTTATLEPVVAELSVLSENADAVMREARLLSESLDPITQRIDPLLSGRLDAEGRPTTGLEQALQSGNQLTGSTLDVLSELRALLPARQPGQERAPLAEEVDRGLRRLFGYLALVGAAWAAFFWGGYYLVRRRAEVRAERMRSGRPPAGAAMSR
jgi:hypothetical protein